MTDRITGVLILGFAIWYGYQATTVKVGFMADPIGPQAVPLILAALTGLVSLYLMIKPDENPHWPTPSLWLRVAIITVSFIIYAYFMTYIGFILATTLEIFLLSLLFRGPVLRSLLAAFLFTLAMYGLFDLALDLNLPTGQLIEGVG